MLEPPEPKGKLDAMTAHAFDVAMAALGANGPEEEDLDWDTIVLPVHEEHVRRLRCRIFKASKARDLAAVRNLQKMMLRSWSNTLLEFEALAATPRR